MFASISVSQFVLFFYSCNFASLSLPDARVCTVDMALTLLLKTTQ